MSAFPGDWNKIIAGLPGAHLLQTREWGEVKAQTGWEALPQVWRDERGQAQAAALVLRRRVRLGGFAAKLSILYAPRGPLLDWSNEALRKRVLDDLQALARKSGAIFLKIDPEVALGTGIPGSAEEHANPLGAALQAELARRGWGYARDQIQFRNTVVLDLSGDEESWLARMKQKARYNLRLAQRKGVSVRQGTPQDFAWIYRMYAETSLRDGFVIRPEAYYRQVWQTFYERGMCMSLLAEVEGEVVAGVMVFVFGGRAWYIYGMSRDLHREKMPNYLLQWEAMRWARQAGALVYDLWGAPEQFDESDAMWGVFRFKEGLGGTVLRTLGAWDYPSRPLVFLLYNNILPRVLDVLRRRGKERTRQEVSA